MTQLARTVLVVDDNSTNRGILTNLLEAHGYRTRAAVDGAEALAALEEEPIDAVLLDIVMPGMDGIEVLRSVKGSVRHWRTPVIMVSAVEETASIVRCLELGAEDYLTKPFDPVVLQARLGACLARKHFHDLEAEYHRLVDEQAQELERLNLALADHVRRTEPPPDPHRADVAVVTLGINGFSELAATAAPGVGLGLAGEFVRVAEGVARRLGGTVSGTTATTVTVVVGDPLPSPDPDGTALRVAEAFLDDMKALTEDWSREHGLSFTAAAGVAGGPALLGPLGADGARSGILGAVVDESAHRCRQMLSRGGGISGGDM